MDTKETMQSGAGPVTKSVNPGHDFFHKGNHTRSNTSPEPLPSGSFNIWCIHAYPYAYGKSRSPPSSHHLNRDQFRHHGEAPSPRMTPYPFRNTFVWQLATAVLLMGFFNYRVSARLYNNGNNDRNKDERNKYHNWIEPRKGEALQSLARLFRCMVD